MGCRARDDDPGRRLLSMPGCAYLLLRGFDRRCTFASSVPAATPCELPRRCNSILRSLAFIIRLAEPQDTRGGAAADERLGMMVSFDLRSGGRAAERFIDSLKFVGIWRLAWEAWNRRFPIGAHLAHWPEHQATGAAGVSAATVEAVGGHRGRRRFDWRYGPSTEQA